MIIIIFMLTSKRFIMKIDVSIKNHNSKMLFSMICIIDLHKNDACMAHGMPL